MSNTSIKKNLLHQERFWPSLERSKTHSININIYNRFLPKLTAVVHKKWNILQTKNNYGDYSKNTQLQNYILSRTGKFAPCLSDEKTLCYNQVLTTNTFMSQRIKWAFNIFFNLNCESEYNIYLIECILCKIQYVGKAGTAFNLRLNNHRKDTKNPNSILACKHFQEQGHNSNKYAKFIIGKLVKLHGSKETLREMLVVRGNF